MKIESTNNQIVISNERPNNDGVNSTIKIAWGEKILPEELSNKNSLNSPEKSEIDEYIERDCYDNDDTNNLEDPYAISQRKNHVYIRTGGSTSADISSRASSSISFRSRVVETADNSRNISLSHSNDGRLVSPLPERQVYNSKNDETLSYLLSPQRTAPRRNSSLTTAPSLNSYQSLSSLETNDLKYDGKNIQLEREVSNTSDVKIKELVEFSHTQLSKISLNDKKTLSAPPDDVKRRLLRKEEQKKLEKTRSKSTKGNKRVNSSMKRKQKNRNKSSACERNHQDSRREMEKKARKMFGSSKKLTIAEKIRVLEVQKVEGVKKSMELKEEEKYLEEKLKDIQENGALISRRIEEINNVLILSKKNFQDKMKLRKSEEMKRRKNENELKKQERMQREQEISEKKRELESLPLEKLSRIEELQEEIKQLEANTFKIEQSNRKLEKKKRMDYDAEEEKLLMQQKEREERETKLAEEIRGQHNNELKSIKSRIQTVKEEKTKHETLSLVNDEKIEEDILHLKQKQKEKLEAEYREKLRLEEQEKEAIRQAMIEIEKQKMETARRRAFNIDMKKSLADCKRQQLVSKPYTYSYFINVPKKVWELPIGWQKRPKYRAGGSKMQ